MAETGFAVWLEKQPGTDIDKAHRLGLKQATLSRYKRGRRTPRTPELRRLMDLTGLPAEAFLPPATHVEASS